METTLRNLCEAHGLTCVSVMLQADFGDHVTVYLHFKVDGESRCASGNGKTFDAAFAQALIDMRSIRDQLGSVA